MSFLPKMRSILLFVFLKFALLRCEQAVQKSAGKRTLLPCEGTGDNNKALQNLMGSGKPIDNKVQLSSPCIQQYYTTGVPTEAMKADGVRVETGIKYDLSRTCYVMGKSDKMVSVKSTASEVPPPGFESCRTPPFQAMYLYQQDNANTYTILDPSIAPWFFTTKLSGCDIFVATSTVPDKLKKPIVIHSNLNSCGNKLQNLRQKGDKVDQMLSLNPDFQGYNLAARAYSKPGKEDMRDAKTYLDSYQRQHPPKVELKSYEIKPMPKAQYFQFLGHYRQSTRDWRFILKGERDGKTQEVLLV